MSDLLSKIYSVGDKITFENTHDRTMLRITILSVKEFDGNVFYDISHSVISHGGRITTIRKDVLQKFLFNN